jgi:hypothetical protein
MKQFEFTDAQTMAQQNPLIFFVPEKGELARIKEGDFVKICINNEERIWVQVTGIEGDTIKGVLAKDPVAINARYGDTIEFERKHIYQIF